MNIKYKYLFGIIGFGLLIWVVDGLVYHFLIASKENPQALWADLLLISVPRFQIFFRLAVVGAYIIFGIIFLMMLERRRKRWAVLKQIHVP